MTAAQSKELATLLSLAERLRVHVSAITPDASALQRFLPFFISNVWPGVITNSGCGRRAIAGGANWRSGMARQGAGGTSLCVDPESVAICGEGGFDPWEAVSVRQPPLPPPGGDFAIALGLALREGVLMNPPINFLPWRQQRRTAFYLLRFWLLMFVASAAGRRDNANTA